MVRKMIHIPLRLRPGQRCLTILGLDFCDEPFTARTSLPKQNQCSNPLTPAEPSAPDLCGASNTGSGLSGWSVPWFARANPGSGDGRSIGIRGTTSQSAQFL